MKLVTLSDVTFLVCLQYLVSFFQCATKVGHNQVLTRGHELGMWKGGGGEEVLQFVFSIIHEAKKSSKKWVGPGTLIT